MERVVFRTRRKTVRNKWEKLLVRRGVKLYGTRWCTMCNKQKALLSNVCCIWEQFYVDCDSLRNVLECSTVKKIPSWRIAGKWYIGAQSEASLKQLVEATGQGNGRWDVAEFSRRHKRRGKWAKEEFADVVKRSILKARASAASDPSPSPPVVHRPKASDVPESGERLNDTKSFLAHSPAKDLIILALAAGAITHKNFQRFLQTLVISNGAPFKQRSQSSTSTRVTSTKPHGENVESFKKYRRKFAPAAAIELETSDLMVCKNEETVAQDHYTRLNNAVGRFRTFGRNPRFTDTQHLTETVVREGEYIRCRNVVVQEKASLFHQLLDLSDTSGSRLKKSLSTIVESLSSGLQNLNTVGVRFTGKGQCKI